MIIPVILSGGSGTRLWPVSRRATPKQFQALQGSDTMLQATAGRLAALPEVAPPIVVCNRSHADQVTSQLIEVGPTVILEPAGRNTAPAVAAACHVALDMDPEAVVVVLPSDHVIGDVAAFASMVETAAGLAGDGRLVTFGVVPTGPATGYGYIKPGDALPGAGHSIGAFIEKPDETTAAGYVAAGYLWNSGMFVFRARAYLSELERLQPEMAVAVADAVNNSVRTGPLIQLDQATWESTPADSIDFAVMEHTSLGAVLPLDAGWNDIGSWDALLDLGESDEDGNVLIGEVHAIDTSGSYVRSGGRPVVVMGLSDVIIVETDDAILVAHRSRAEDVKQVVDRLPDHQR